MSQGGVKIPSNLAKNSNCIKPHVSTSRDASICKEIRESAKIFNRTQNINLNPFLVLTPKNLTRSSLSETNIETYITSEEMEALYEDAVSTDQSVKVLFLPDIELSEEQIQNIVERISLDISKEEGRNCKELMLIPLDLLKNRVETPSSEIPATTVVEDSACQNNWSLPWHSDSGETNYQQEPSENTFSSSSSDFETTAGVTNLTTSTSQQTCQTLTTETDFSDPILPNDIPVYPETTTPCPTLSTDNFSFSNFSSSGASAVNESSVKDDQNQELAKEEQNCSTQLKNETHHQTEIFIPCFIKIGHENNSLEKKICEMQQNGCITKFLSHQYLFNSQDDHIKINSGGTISSNSECLQPLPPCSKGEMVDPISSGSPYQTSASATVEPVNNWLSGSSKIDSSQSICDSVHFKEEEKPVSDKKKSEITTYPHQNNSGSSPSPQYCAAEQTSDVTQSSSSFNVITYPITIDSEVKPILQPCTTEEGAWNSGSYGKYGVAREKNVIDQFETVNSNRDVTRISNEYCHCERTNAIKTSLNTQQTEYPVTNIHSLDLIKKNAKDNYHIVVGKDYISHPEKGITILDSIKKNAKINDFTAISGERSGLTGESKLTCSSNIGSLTQNTQEYDINSSLERKKVDPCSSSDGSKESENEDSRQSSDNKLSSSYNIVTTPGNQICNLTKKQDEAKSIPEIKPEVPKCPTSRVFIVKIDNIKPNNGSCPCSSFNSLVDTVCSHENLKNTYSKDHNCLCKLLSRNRQRIGQPEDTQPELNLNETCASSAYPPTPQDISGYDVIPKDECRNSDESIPPLEITQTSPVSNTYHSTKNSTECDKNITTNTEIHTSYKSPMNKSPMNEYCLPCNLGNFIELQRNVSQKIEEYAQKTCINNIPLSPVCQGKEVPIVYPPSDKITIETPIKEPVIQTFTEAHKIPVPEICPPTEKPIYKPAVQNPSTLHSIENTTRNLQIRHKVPSLDICPPTSGYSEMSGIPFNKPTAEKPPMPKPVLNTRNLQAPQKIPSTYICPPTVEYKKTSGIPVPVIKPTAQTVSTPPRSSHICPPSQEHGKTNLEQAIIQTHPTHHKITKPATCSSTNEYTKKTEIPVSKSTAETISTQQDICVPIPKDCPPSYSHKTNGDK
ncbi:hypothetical protein LSTR_LSTR016382 [Laodelphax striatellus]|uniref:Uncharacterized protein n=1 Tax=Laodelphax striatellus TaxID=195883 RepID=A0A482X267_LAOST|nr:hypothetical protein LSTR_LSTR016382 [Laodelphax striatellus]